MKHLSVYKLFEATKPGLIGSMDIVHYNMVKEDIADILLDLTDQHYNFRTMLNGIETPSVSKTGNIFSVEIYNQTPEGSLGWYMGRFKWEDVSDYVLRIYDYMVSGKWIGTWTPSVSGVCVYYKHDHEMDSDEYKFFRADWGRFKHGMEYYYNEHELRSIKIEFTLGR